MGVGVAVGFSVGVAMGFLVGVGEAVGLGDDSGVGIDVSVGVGVGTAEDCLPYRYAAATAPIKTKSNTPKIAQFTENFFLGPDGAEGDGVEVFWPSIGQIVDDGWKKVKS